MSGRSMRQRPRISYAETDNPQQMIQAQQQMMANQAMQASRGHQVNPMGNQSPASGYNYRYFKKNQLKNNIFKTPSCFRSVLFSTILQRPPHRKTV